MRVARRGVGRRRHGAEVARVRLLLLPVGDRLDARRRTARARTTPRPARRTGARRRHDQAGLRRRRDAVPDARPPDRHAPSRRRHASRPTSPMSMTMPTLDPRLRRRQLARARDARDVRHRRSRVIPTCATSTCRASSRAIPLRKDFPLLSRMVKPWPGIVDVEPMPGVEDERRGRAARRA